MPEELLNKDSELTNMSIPAFLEDGSGSRDILTSISSPMAVPILISIDGAVSLSILKSCKVATPAVSSSGRSVNGPILEDIGIAMELLKSSNLTSSF